MPAKRIRRKSNPKKGKSNRKYIYYIIVLLLLIIGSFVTLRTNKWNSKEKLSLLVKNSDYSHSIIVFDPVLEEIYKLRIPENTEIEVAGGYGIWKVKSLWNLGEQEGLDGELAARSITMGLGLPVYAWADEQGLGLAEPGLKSSFRALFSNYKSNLTFGDKLGIILFNTKVKNTKRININLNETSFLEKRILSGGEEGYKVTESPPQRITSIFSEPLLSTGIMRVSIKNSKATIGSAKKVGKVIEVLGGKISAVDTYNDFDGVCILRSKDQKILDILLKVFECEEYSLKSDDSFDVEIILGNDFAKKY